MRSALKRFCTLQLITSGWQKPCSPPQSLWGVSLGEDSCIFYLSLVLCNQPYGYASQLLTDCWRGEGKVWTGKRSVDKAAGRPCVYTVAPVWLWWKLSILRLTELILLASMPLNSWDKSCSFWMRTLYLALYYRAHHWINKADWLALEKWTPQCVFVGSRHYEATSLWTLTK